MPTKWQRKAVSAHVILAIYIQSMKTMKDMNTHVALLQDMH